MCGGYKKGENPSEFGIRNKLILCGETNFAPAGLRGRVIFGREGNKVTIGDRIRRIRKKRRLTQAELAMMSGLSLSAIQGYEQGRYEPKRKSLESIAEVFKIPVDELYDMPAELSTNLAEVGTDCISRQQAIDALSELATFTDEWGEHTWMYTDDVYGAIKQLPTIQPEIVRCGECKWFQCNMSPDGYLPQGVDEFECRHWCGSCDPTDFCSYAERREDEH